MNLEACLKEFQLVHVDIIKKEEKMLRMLCHLSYQGEENVYLLTQQETVFGNIKQQVRLEYQLSNKGCLFSCKREDLCFIHCLLKKKEKEKLFSFVIEHHLVRLKLLVH